MPPTVLGLDIGGANLKAATADKRAASVPFALWKQPDRLPAVLAELVARFPDAEELAVTMTGELCDCFETKRAGVNAILDAVHRAAAGRPVRVWGTNAGFVSDHNARNDTLDVASANWCALARYVGRHVSTGPGLLLDVGSTTTDIIPLWGSDLLVRGSTDPERLRCGELVYTGVRRTPVCAVLGGRVAAEVFATTHDAYLLLEWVAEDPADTDTADGRPATIPFAHARMSRMLCGDPEITSAAETRRLAETVMDRQLDLIATAIDRLTVGRPWTNPEPCVVVLSGSGWFLGRELVARGRIGNAQPVVLAEELGPDVSACAPAYAVAVLAAERRS